MPDAAGEHLLTPDGIAVHVEGTGAETILMVHGWPDTWRLWDGAVNRLRGDHRCLRFTLPGFDIDGPREAWSLERIVDWLRRLVELACPGQRVTLLLHDWGCLFGYQFALRHPARVARIIGVDVGDAGSREHRSELGARAKAMIFGYQIWLALAWRIGGSLGDRMTRAMARWLRCPSDQRWIGSTMCYPYDIQWTGSHGSYRGLLPLQPQCPMLFIYGQRKPMQFHSAAWAAALAARPGNRVVAMPTGHWVMTSRPDEFARVLRDWLAGH